ncbi:cbb3-type cytochrome oxidase assembly protein CcoS [Gemmobacter nectariphilus]|uniref:cbb3-type cytochrome oxidase assembly protein CcoS n=1 Tax=Gemmobacter nectariphilus TaxID=220343 RepID=UPI00048126B2|nr:cbb3-type cytochrome oxidase assembly protein CcoS [Gemmobacter nectariphilus]
MSALLVLIPVSIGMGLVGLGAFFWAMRHDQFDDPEGNARRVLAPENPVPAPNEGETHV